MACLNRYFSSKASFRQYEYMAVSAEEMFRDPRYLKQYFITFGGVGKCCKDPKRTGPSTKTPTRVRAQAAQEYFEEPDDDVG
jgi:hypothetical protein